MRIVVDTNVLISGLFWRNGAPRQVLQVWLSRKVTVLGSREILDEYRGVTARISARKKIDVTNLLERLLMQMTYISSTNLPSQICEDADDDKFIATAFSGRASFLISGDAALLRVARFKKIKIIAPATFLKVMS